MIYGVEPEGYWDDEPESVTAAREAAEEREYQEEIGQEMAWEREDDLEEWGLSLAVPTNWMACRAKVRAHREAGQ